MYPVSAPHGDIALVMFLVAIGLALERNKGWWYPLVFLCNFNAEEETVMMLSMGGVGSRMTTRTACLEDVGKMDEYFI